MRSPERNPTHLVGLGLASAQLRNGVSLGDLVTLRQRDWARLLRQSAGLSVTTPPGVTRQREVGASSPHPW